MADSNLGLRVGVCILCCDLHHLTPNVMTSTAKVIAASVQLQSLTGNILRTRVPLIQSRD